jgi:hypothetical protein
MNVVTAAAIVYLQKQRIKLQKAERKFARASIAAFKRWDFEKGITNGAKALAAHQADKILADQQQAFRRTNP